MRIIFIVSDFFFSHSYNACLLSLYCEPGYLLFCVSAHRCIYIFFLKDALSALGFVHMCVFYFISVLKYKTYRHLVFQVQ